MLERPTYETGNHSTLFLFLYLTDQLLMTFIGTYGIGIVIYFLYDMLFPLKKTQIIFCLMIGTLSLIHSYFSPCGITKHAAVGAILLTALIHSIIRFDSIAFFSTFEKFFKSIFIIIFVIITINYFFNFNLLGSMLGASYITVIFAEKSHLGIYMLPLVLWTLSNNSNTIVKKVIAVSPTLIMTSTTTLIAYLIFFLSFIKLKLNYFLIAILIASLWFTLDKLTSYDATNMSIEEADIAKKVFFQAARERITGVFELIQLGIYEGRNLSVLVFLNGYSTAWENFISTSGVGLGINNMGCNGDPGLYTDAIVNLIYTPINSNDGSFVSSKLVSEYGIFGITFIMLTLIIIIFNLSKILENSTFSLNSAHVIARISLVLFIVTMFIRTPGGYFTMSSLLLFGMIYGRK